MELDDELCLCFHVTKRKVINYIRVPWPTEVHGLTIDSAGKLWYCDAETTAVGILGR